MVDADEHLGLSSNTRRPLWRRFESVPVPTSGTATYRILRQRAINEVIVVVIAIVFGYLAWDSFVHPQPGKGNISSGVFALICCSIAVVGAIWSCRAGLFVVDADRLTYRGAFRTYRLKRREIHEISTVPVSRFPSGKWSTVRIRTTSGREFTFGDTAVRPYNKWSAAHQSAVVHALCTWAGVTSSRPGQEQGGQREDGP